MVMWLSIAVLLAGLLLYGFATNPKLVRIGEIMFFCGLLAFLLVGGRELLTVLHT